MLLQTIHHHFEQSLTAWACEGSALTRGPSLENIKWRCWGILTLQLERGIIIKNLT